MAGAQAAGCPVPSASMKALPKRKGNPRIGSRAWMALPSLNESPSEKEGKWKGGLVAIRFVTGLNESPSEKEGKS